VARQAVKEPIAAVRDRQQHAFEIRPGVGYTPLYRARCAGCAE
jgi:hypothetical protein